MEIGTFRICSINEDLRKMLYEAQTLPQRPVGRAVGSYRASVAPRERASWSWPTPRDGLARGRQCSVLPCPRGLYLAGAAPRLPAVEDGLQLLPVVGLGRNLATAPR